MDISSVANQLRKARFNYQVNSKIVDRFWAGEVRRFHVDPKNVTYDISTHCLVVTDLGVSLYKVEHSFILKGIAFARALRKQAGARFDNVDELILIRLGDLTFEVRTFEELFILHEIFVELVYNLKLPGQAVVVDIGANVGFTSILFAHDPNVTRVIAFEPVEVTYQHALRNLTINKQCAAKIELHNYGLSDKEETIEIEFSDEIKGSVGIRGLAHRDDIDRSRIRKEKLHLLEAGSEIKKVIDGCNGMPVFLKMDCEGSEYQIVDNLIDTGQLPRVAGIMMEWHDSQLLSELETKLTSAGFTVFSLSPNGTTVGMLYASQTINNDRQK